MPLSKLFSRDSTSSTESSTRKMNSGREVLKGKLWMRKARTSKRQMAEVVVYSATHDGKLSGQIEIFEEIYKTYQKPKKVVLLTDIAPPGVQSGQPCTSSSLSSSPAAQSPKNSFMGTSPSSSSIVLYPFQIVIKNGEVFEFFTETLEDQRQWLKRLGLLIMFPYSPIPEEPMNNPIKPQFKAKLNPKDYDADSIWAVYILPEEVGSRVHLLGIHLLCLKSGVSEGHPGQLSIISLADPTPVVTWDRDKMRRTGCLGNMVFVEIGRRCRGGPGLIWMYAGPDETAALRETLHMFLFKGDGRAVPISAQRHQPDPHRASFDSGFPPSYSKRGSQSSLQRSPSINTPQRQVSVDSQNGSDSGHGISPHPPPVDMGSHPNRHKQGRSAPRNISVSSQYENTSVDSGVTSQRSSSCRDSLASVPDSFCDEQFELDTEKSSPNDSLIDDRFPAGSLEPDQVSSARHYSLPSIPAKQLHRSHSTATCHPSQRSDEYERMMHPKQHAREDGYIFMQPATGPESALQQLRSLSDSPSRVSPPRLLGTINEDKVASSDQQDSSIYENFPLDRDIENETFTCFMTTYENIDNVRQELSRQSLAGEEATRSPSGIHRSNSHSSHKETVVLGEKLKSCSPPQKKNVRTVQCSPPVMR